METEWSFCMNPVLIATADSNVLGKRINNWHDGALYANRANVVILAMYNIYHPISVIYVNANAKWKSLETIQISKTAIFTAAIKDTGSARINAWDAAIQIQRPKGTPGYLALLAHGHDPFQHGTQEEIKDQVLALSMAIGTDAAWQPLKVR